jgi:hypothetical protein
VRIKTDWLYVEDDESEKILNNRYNEINKIKKQETEMKRKKDLEEQVEKEKVLLASLKKKYENLEE